MRTSLHTLGPVSFLWPLEGPARTGLRVGGSPLRAFRDHHSGPGVEGRLSQQSVSGGCDRAVEEDVCSPLETRSGSQACNSAAGGGDGRR